MLFCCPEISFIKSSISLLERGEKVRGEGLSADNRLFFLSGGFRGKTHTTESS